MINYLKDFFTRTRPLVDYSAFEKQIFSDFEKKWEEGALPGWPRTNYDEAGDLENNELYCQACRKLFTNSSIFAHHLEGKRHKACVKNMEKGAQKTQ